MQSWWPELAYTPLTVLCPLGKPRTTCGPWLSPVFTLPAFQPLHCRSAVPCPHPGRHCYFANQTCPALPGRQAVCGDFLHTAVLIMAWDSCKLQSQRAALPARGDRVLSLTPVLLSLVVHLRGPPPLHRGPCPTHIGSPRAREENCVLWR